MRGKIKLLFSLMAMAVVLLSENISFTVSAEESHREENLREEPTSDLPAVRHVSVHDPSIFEDADGVYYIVGSHTASAKSEDLIAWEQINADYKALQSCPFYGKLNETFAKPFAWAGYDDGDCSGGGYAIWAPDLIWNPYYVWEDGETGAYMLYCCTSSTWRRSCISFLVSKTVEGPYAFGDTIVYSGFTQNGKPDGKSSRNTRWDNDYLNLKKLVELGVEQGGIDEVSERWFSADGGWDHTYGPNAIDPNLFFDADGTRLYMSYGSWSGGMFLLELDPTTGEAIYPGTDFVDEASGNYVDRYFGVHLIGGNHQSGEGPYITYDEETGYYYFYCTYGGLQAEGGYNMRLFRSEHPTGPYLDAAGNNAADNAQNLDAYGIKLIGNYAFFDQIGKRAAGHNSQLTRVNGERYLIYHQRFDITPQLEAHEARVHQQFMNEDAWPVTAVYEYRGEQPEHYALDELIGSYEYINHGTKTNGEMLTTGMVTLEEDGKVSGSVTGSWEKTDSGKGYDFVTFHLDNLTYKGIFFRQHKENADPEAVMTFTAIGEDNTCIWGSMIDTDNKEMMVQMAAVALDQIVPAATREDLVLPEEIMGCRISWATADASIITDQGKVFAQEEDTRVQLTADISNDEAKTSKTFKVTVRQAPVLICGYDFEAADTSTEENSETPQAEKTEENSNVPPEADSALAEPAQLCGQASIIEDPERGYVLSIENEEGAKGVNYLKLPEDTFREIGPVGYSVAMWVKIGGETFEHSALFEADAKGDYPLTRIGANLIARINANTYSDVMGSLLTTSGEREVWEHVAYTVDPYGIRVYLNGKLVGEEEKNIKDCFKKNATGICRAKDVMVGSGFIWGDEDCRKALFDDVRVYRGVLTASEIEQLAQ